MIYQLLLGSEDNMELLETIPEAIRQPSFLNLIVSRADISVSRRGLGTMLLEEKNEILRVICGRIIALLVDFGIPRHNLWPVTTKGHLYSKFPETKPNGSQWDIKFQDYLDDLCEAVEDPDQ